MKENTKPLLFHLETARNAVDRAREKAREAFEVKNPRPTWIDDEAWRIKHPCPSEVWARKFARSYDRTAKKHEQILLSARMGAMTRQQLFEAVKAIVDGSATVEVSGHD